MDNKLFSCGIFIDLKKAFDTVDHSILLNKLNQYGIRGIVNDWFSSYLFKRTQTTEINSFISDKEINCPMWCSTRLSAGSSSISDIYNDIPNSSKKLNFFLFADDTNIIPSPSRKPLTKS